MQAQNQYVDFLNDPNFEGVNKHFVLSFENEAGSRREAQYIFFQYWN